MRILVVEDEPDLAGAIATGLRREGYAVDVAPDGRSALERLPVTDYDLVCLDLNLPDMDGLEVCRQISESASADGADAHAGADAHGAGRHRGSHRGSRRRRRRLPREAVRAGRAARPDACAPAPRRRWNRRRPPMGRSHARWCAPRSAQRRDADRLEPEGVRAAPMVPVASRTRCTAPSACSSTSGTSTPTRSRTPCA